MPSTLSTLAIRVTFSLVVAQMQASGSKLSDPKEGQIVLQREIDAGNPPTASD